MSVAPISARLAQPAPRSLVAHWESAFVALALVLSMSAFVPLIFNPSATPESGLGSHDPVSQPAWALIGLLFLVAAARMLPQITGAAMRNLPLVALLLPGPAFDVLVG